LTLWFSGNRPPAVQKDKAPQAREEEGCAGTRAGMWELSTTSFMPFQAPEYAEVQGQPGPAFGGLGPLCFLSQ
uniref:Uncharacterized protein n=1 Tax=Prolemur simus TaxID=1328070 RepID=A0A8C9DNV6_PROSS